MPNVQAATIFTAGFETGDLTEFAGPASPAPTVTTDEAHTGTYSAEFQADDNVLNRECYEGSSANMFLHCWIKWDGFTPQANWQQDYLQMRNSSGYMMGGAVVASYNYGTNYYLQAAVYNNNVSAWVFHGSGQGLDVTSIDSNWHYLACEYEKGSGTNTLTVYLDDEEVDTWEVSTSENYVCDGFCLGGHNIGGYGSDYWMDDIVFAEEYVSSTPPGDSYSFDLEETCNVTASLYTQKNLYRGLTETTVVSSSLGSRKTLIRYSGESTEVTTTVIETKAIHFLLVEISETTVISATLETVKHLVATLIELQGLINISALLVEILPTIPLTTEDLIGLIILFFVVGLACSVALTVALRKK